MLKFLFNKMEQPTPFGLFHLTFFLVIVLSTIILVHYFKDSDNKTFRKILFILWIIIVTLEIQKQIIFNYDINNKTWLSYSFSTFPYQFCSLPLYIMPLLVFLKDSKFRDLLLIFSSTFIFFGGFGYFFFPVSFCNYVLINIQTMIHHGIQIISGILIYAHEKDKFNYKMVLKSVLLLICSIIIAILLNIILSKIAIDGNNVNLFELSPANKTQAPVFSDILNATNYICFLFIYIIGFLGFSSITYYSMKYIDTFINFIKNRLNRLK